MINTFLALSLSVDAFSAGLSYGVRQVKIPLKQILVIALTSCLMAFISILFGKALLAIGGDSFKLVGSILLGLMGLFIILFRGVFYNDTGFEKCLINLKFFGVTFRIILNPNDCDLNASGTIETKEAFLLAFALSIDMLSAGTAFAMSGGGIIFAVVSGITQPLFLFLGQLSGHKFTVKIKKLFFKNDLSSNSFVMDRYFAYLSGVLLLIVAFIRYINL